MITFVKSYMFYSGLYSTILKSEVPHVSDQINGRFIMKKIVKVMCCFLLIGSLLTACSPSPDTNVGTEDTTTNNANTSTDAKEVNLRFSWWGGDARHQATLDSISIYMDKNPNVKISAEYTGDMGGYRDKLATQVASGSAPDIIQVDVTWLPGYAERGDIFSDMLEYKDTIDTSSLDQDFIDNFSMYDNKLLGLPLGINAVTFMYNSELVKKAGINIDPDWDWETFISEGKKLHEMDSNLYFLNIDPQSLHENIFSNYVRQRTGNKLVNDDYTLGFDKQAASEAYEVVRRMFDENICQPASESTVYNKGIDKNPKWIANEFAATVNYGSNIALFRPGLGGTAAEAANIPVIKDANNTSIIVRPQSFICINNKSAEKQESAKFINFFLNDEESQLALKDTRSVPPTETARKALDEAGLIDSLSIKVVDQALPRAGLADNNLSTDQQLNDAGVSVMEKIMFGAVTPEEAADELISQFTDIVNSMKENQE